MRLLSKGPPFPSLPAAREEKRRLHKLRMIDVRNVNVMCICALSEDRYSE